MRAYDQKEIWLHGSRLTIRRAPVSLTQPRRVNWRRPERRHRIIGQYVLFLNGRYVARVTKKQLRKWAQHFALKEMLN